MNFKAPTFRVLTTAAVLCVASSLAQAASNTNTWKGAGTDDYWSTADNWAGGALNSDAVVLFTNLDVAGTMGPGGSPNSIVRSNQTIQGLYCYNTNTSAGAGHTIQINPGVSLTITGSVSPVVFIGSGNAVEAGKDATNYTTILGAGSLVITNPAGDFFVRQVSGFDGKHYATLDLSGLDTFNASVNRITVAATTGTGINTRAGGALRLAKTNVIVCAFATTAQGLLIGEAQSQNSTTVPQALHLGQTNAIFSDAGLTVGRQKATGWLGFNTNLVMDNPFVLFRDRAGTGRQGTWLIGEHATGATTTGNKGIADFSYGTVDAMVDTMYVGRGQTSGGTAAGQGWLMFTNGTIDVNTLNIGYQRSDGAPGRGWVFVDGGAKLTVNNNLMLGNTVAPGTTPSLGVLGIGTNVPGGSVWVKGDILDGGLPGGGTNELIYIDGGSLKVGGTVGATNALQNMTLNNATLTFDCGGNGNPAAPLWRIVRLTVYGPVTNNLEGSAFSVGQFPLLSYDPGYFGGDLNSFVLGSLPPLVQGYLSNNTANSSIDMVITKVAALKWNGQTNDVPIGNWDINVTANWLPLSGGGPAAYTQPTAFGDQVFFDDTATGTTTVNLTTLLAPYNVSVNNSSKDYAFTGAGALTGSTTLNKSGTGKLTLSNVGSNDFTGAVTINAGTVMLSGSADRLPTNAAVTLADEASAKLDLNGQNQALGSLSGGGGSGGNVALGAGTLTIQAGGGAYSGEISGGGAVVKSGSGTQTFNGASSYGGGTLVTGGTLIVANTSGSGVGSGSVTVATNGYFQIGGGGANGSIAVGTITNNGWVVLNRNDDLTFTTHLVGPGSFLKQNSNTVSISTPNNWSGMTSIGNGAVRISDPAATGTGLIYIGNSELARLELVGGVTLTQAMTVVMKPAGAGLAPSILNVSGTNTVAGPMAFPLGGTYWNISSGAGKLVVSGPFTSTVTSGTHTLRLFGDGEGDWWSSISDGPGITAVAMAGNGTWTLSGTNTYTGKTTVTTGSLVVKGALAGSSAISVNGGLLTISGAVTGGTNVTVGTDVIGASATMTGKGFIGDPVTITGGATLCGNSVTALGTLSGAPMARLTVSNALTLRSACTTVMGVSPSGSDQVVGLSSVSFAGMLQVVLTSGTLAGGEVFKLFDSSAYSDTDFDGYLLPDLGTLLLSWDTSAMRTNGILRVAGSLVPQVLSISSSGPGNFQFSGTGPVDWPYTILATTNLAQSLSNWVQVSSGTFIGGAFTFSDPNAALYRGRFYQVVTRSP